MDSGYQVFISFKNTDERGRHTRDRALAEELDRLVQGLGVEVFFSEHTLRDEGDSQYSKAIAEALDSSMILIAVGTSTENLESSWVFKEWDVVLNEIASGRKEGGQLFSYVDGVEIDHLPIMLRGRQVFTHGPGAMEELGHFVVNRLRKLGEQDLDGEVSSPVGSAVKEAGASAGRRRRWPLVAGALLLLVSLGGLASFFFSGEGTGSDLQLSETSAGDQFLPSLAVLDSDRFLAVWTSDHEAGNGPDIYGRVFESGGGPLGGEFRINTHLSGEQGVPSIAAVGDGGFVAVWNSDGQDGDGWGIYGQLFDAEAKPVRGEFLVNSNWTRGGQRVPGVASNDGGDFVVVWDGAGEGDEWGVYGQRFDGRGARVGEVFRATPTTAGRQRFAAVAPVDGGGFAVAWEHEGEDGGDPFGVRARIFGPSGRPTGEPFPVNSHMDGRQRYPTLAGHPSGGFVALWTSEGQDGAGRGVYGQRFSADGGRQGEEFQVNSTVQDHQWLPKVAAGADGFAAVWVSDRQDGSGASVVFQRFGSDGTRAGSELILNGATEGDQIVRSIAAQRDGHYLVAWESAGQDGDGKGVFLRVVGP